MKTLTILVSFLFITGSMAAKNIQPKPSGKSKVKAKVKPDPKRPFQARIPPHSSLPQTPAPSQGKLDPSAGSQMGVGIEIPTH
jgi:hypothetical protein